MADEAEQPRRGRAEQERQQRRRRDDTAVAASKLPIPPEVQEELDRKGLVPRWVNDEDNRIYRFTVQDDYDRVEGVDPVPVGTGKDGKPTMAHLLAKPREFIEEDRRKADAKRREVEDALVRSPDAPDQAGASANPNPASAQRYIAKGSNISRGNQILTP